MARLAAAQAQAGERAGLGAVARLTAYKTFRRLVAIPCTTIMAEDGQKIRDLFIKDDLEHSITIKQGGTGRGYRTLNSPNISIVGEEIIEVITGDFKRQVTQVHNGQLLAMFGDRNVYFINTQAFIQEVVATRLFLEGQTYFSTLQELGTLQNLRLEALTPLVTGQMDWFSGTLVVGNAAAGSSGTAQTAASWQNNLKNQQ